MLTMASFFVLFNRFFSRIRETPSGVPPDVYKAARTIAQETGVPFVVMGHTHLAEVRPIDDRGTLFVDTGTWTSISGAGASLWPSNRRFTFARLLDHQIELLRWNDLAGRVDEVFMFEDYQRKPADVLFPEDPSQAVHLPQRAKTIASDSDTAE